MNLISISSIWLYICCLHSRCPKVSCKRSNSVSFSHSIASNNNQSLNHKRRSLRIKKRIIGGKLTVPTQYPYFTYLEIFYRSSNGLCGGSLVAPDMVLTAAHCIHPSNGIIYRILAKVNYTQNTGNLTGYEYVRNVRKQIPFPKYDILRNSGDVALLLLDQPVIGVPLIKLNAISRTPSVGQPLTMIGFGDTSNGKREFPKYLLEVSVSTVSQKDCNDENSYEGKIIETDMICAGNTSSGGKDACGGDSGGPLLVTGRSILDDIQVGISSFGEECGRPDFPGVYTRVSTYLPWIQDMICQVSQKKPSSCIKTRNPIRSRPTLKPRKPTKEPK
jgi:secreted trypsin-like serine protease